MLKKYSFGTIIVLHTMQCAAFDFTPDTNRILSDPSYLPLAGQVYDTTQYGVTFPKNAIADNGIKQSLGYGISDFLSIQVSDNYDWTKYNSGFYDPSFGLKLRLLKQQESGFNLDLIADYSPDLLTNNRLNHYARGGQVSNFISNISYTTTDFTILGFAEITALSSAIQNDSFLQKSISEHQSFGIGIDTQIRIARDFSINAGVSEQFMTNYDISYSSYAKFSYNGYNTTTFNTALNYHVIPNRLVTSLGYSNSFYNDSYQVISAYPSSGSFNINTNSVNFSLRFVLN